MTSVQDPSWRQLNESISTRREELRQLEQQADLMRHRAIAAARNILRAHGVSVAELSELLAHEAEASSGAQRSGGRVRRVAVAKASASGQPIVVDDASPLSRLSSTVKTVLANQGLRTFEAIAEAVAAGHPLQRMGPHRRAQLDAWLIQERGASQPQARQS